MKSIFSRSLSRPRILALAAASALLGAWASEFLPDTDSGTEASAGNSGADPVRPKEDALGAPSRNVAMAPTAPIVDATPVAVAVAGGTAVRLVGVERMRQPTTPAPWAPPGGVRPARVGNLRVVSTDP